MTVLLGIVGSPAAGKSTVASLLSDWGAEWINADLIARDQLGVPEVTEKLAERFGNDLLDSDGQVVRSKLADHVFADSEAGRESLQFLESVVHPRVRLVIKERIVEAARQGVDVALLDVPLLFESNWDLSCDSIWCVDAERANRLARAEIRGWDGRELSRREARQLPIETKIRLSNLVMRNDSTLEALVKNLRQPWEKLAKIEVGEPLISGTTGQSHCLSD